MATIKKAAKRAEDLTAEEAERMRRSLTRNAIEVKIQPTLKELKKLRKQGREPKPRGKIIEGDNNIKLGQGIGYTYR